MEIKDLPIVISEALKFFFDINRPQISTTVHKFPSKSVCFVRWESALVCLFIQHVSSLFNFCSSQKQFRPNIILSLNTSTKYTVKLRLMDLEWTVKSCFYRSIPSIHFSKLWKHRTNAYITCVYALFYFFSFSFGCFNEKKNQFQQKEIDVTFMCNDIYSCIPTYKIVHILTMYHHKQMQLKSPLWPICQHT